MSERDAVTDRGGTNDGDLRIVCKADATGYGLDVDWTSGALFHFESEAELEAWIERQNRRVPGTFYARSDVSGDDALSPDYYLTYCPPSEE